MRLYLIRHGQSSNNALWTETQSDKGRSFDPVLTDIGRAQAECAARFIRDELHTHLPLNGQADEPARPALLYTSLMTRAVETGEVIARALDAPLVALPDAHEVGGLYLQDETTGEKAGIPGPNRAHFETRYPALQLPQELDERGWWNRPHEGKALRAARAARVWEFIMARHGASADILGLVTHGGFYNYLLAHILNMPARENIWFTLNNCAITRLDVRQNEIALVYQNRFDFLPPEWLT